MLAGSLIWGLVTDNSSSMLELGHGGCLGARQRPGLHLAAGESPTGLQEAGSCGGFTPICRVTLVLWNHVWIFSFLGNGLDQTISKTPTWSKKNNLHPGGELWLGRLTCHSAARGPGGPGNSTGRMAMRTECRWRKLEGRAAQKYRKHWERKITGLASRRH